MQRKHEHVELTCRSVLAIYLMAAIVLFLTPDRASAQGIPLVPDPIDSRELMDYAERLTLSRQQKLAILPMHDAYFKRFARLRDRDIQDLQDDLMELIASINPMNLAIPPREDIETLVRQYDLILEKIQSVDRQLFNDIRTILTDEQMLLVDLVNRARERSLYRQVTLEMGGEFNPGTGIDLSELVRDLDLTSSVKVGVNPILRTYESALLERIRKLHREIKQIVTLVLDTIDDLGLREMSMMEMGEQFNDEDFQESIMALFDEASRPFQKATSDISRLNFTTYQRLAKLLESNTRRKLRDDYFKRVYSRAVRGLSGANEHFRRVLKLEGLSEEQREQIIQLRETFHVRNKPVILEIAGLIEDSRRYRTVMQLDDEGVGPQDKKIQKLTERREQITESTKKSIIGILGPELMAQIDVTPTAEQSRLEQLKEQFGEDVARQIEESGVDINELDLPVPTKVESKGFSPIPPRLIEEYAATLKLDESQRSILDSLYDDYRISFADLLAPPPESPDAPNSSLTTEGEEADTLRLALEKAKGSIETFKSIQEMDASFFTNIGLVMEGEQTETQLESFSLKRRRELYLQSLAEPRRFNNELNESRIDLTQLLDDLDLTERDRESSNDALHEYERESVVMLEQMNKVTMEMARLRALGDVMNRERPEASQTLKTRRQKSLNSFKEARTSLKNINRTHLAKLQARLSEDSRWGLVRLYNEQTYPEIYQDDRSAETLIVSVLELEDLSGSQRDGLQQLAADYRERYHNFSQEMVDIVSQRENQSFNGTIPIDMILRELEHEKLKYERNESSERAKARIKLMLSDEQIMLAKKSNRAG